MQCTWSTWRLPDTCICSSGGCQFIRAAKEPVSGCWIWFPRAAKAMVWLIKCDLMPKKRETRKRPVFSYRWSMRGNVAEMGIVKMVASTELSSFNRGITDITLPKDYCRILKCGEAQTGYKYLFPWYINLSAKVVCFCRVQWWYSPTTPLPISAVWCTPYTRRAAQFPQSLQLHLTRTDSKQSRTY